MSDKLPVLTPEELRILRIARDVDEFLPKHEDRKLCVSLAERKLLWKDDRFYKLGIQGARALGQAERTDAR